MGLSEAELDRFVRLEDLQQRIAALKLEEAELIADIVEAHGVGVSPKIDGTSVAEIQQPMKFSADKARKVLSIAPELLALVEVESRTISAAKAKELLPPETYELCKVKNGNPKIKFKEDKP